jgi:hypothetical protein
MVLAEYSAYAAISRLLGSDPDVAYASTLGR